MKTSYVIVILGVLLGFDQAYAINHYKEFQAGRWDLDAVASYMRSSANYASGGGNQALVGNNYFQLLDFLTGARWGITEEMNLYIYGNIASAESKGVNATRTNSGLSKVVGGGEILINMDGFHVVPEFQFVYNAQKVDMNSDDVLISEGANEITGKVNVQTEMDSFLLYGYLGFTYRDSGRSNLLPWGVTGEYAMQKVRLGLELSGFQSITSDKDKGELAEGQRTVYLGQVNAGSARFFSIDPSIVDLNFTVKFNTSPKLNMWIAAGHTLTGSNYSAGFHFEGGLRYTLGEGRQSKSKSNYSNENIPTRTTKKVNKFEEDTNDGVDQRMFKPTPTPAPQPQPKKKPQVSGEKLQEKMDDVEMEIELKRNKKTGG